MATYNGEKYLATQLDSLLSQTYTNFKVWVQDDVSTDSTWEILNVYKNRYPDKFHITRRETNSGSSMNNFFDLMITTRDDYLMLCDQDDVWLPDKIEKTMAKMKSLENNHSNIPALVHTDLKVVDQNLNVINPSYKMLTNRNYNRMAFHQVLNLNNVSGCTVMYNRALADLLTEPPKYCLMHDWWLQLLAVAFGKVDHIDDGTLLYRQHGDNACGAKDVRKLSYKLERLRNGKNLRKTLHETCKQAGSLLEMYQDKLTTTQKYILEGYSAIPQMGKFERIKTIFRLRTFMPSLTRNIAFFLFI